MNPFFSVIITTYNRLAFLPKAIDSVMKQSFQNFELIIVNDASIDQTKNYLDQLNNAKIKVFHNEKNLHKGGTRNVGIQHCSGKFTCFLDDDDYYLLHHLQTFYDFITKNNIDNGLMYTMPISYNIKTKEIFKRVLEPIGKQHPVPYLFFHKNGVPTPRVCITTEILKKEFFNPDIKIGQDTELFLRIAANHAVYPINEHTAVQVRHESNSGHLGNNAGLMRLNGYKYIFSNPEVSQHISKKLKGKMYAYCYLRMCDHYSFIGNRYKTITSAIKSMWYSGSDGQFKTKLVFILYHLPGGRIIKRLTRNFKQKVASS